MSSGKYPVTSCSSPTNILLFLRSSYEALTKALIGRDERNITQTPGKGEYSSLGKVYQLGKYPAHYFPRDEYSSDFPVFELILCSYFKWAGWVYSYSKLI